MHCEYCGSEISSEASFCSHCGKKKNEKPSTSIIIEFIRLTLDAIGLFIIASVGFLIIDYNFIDGSYESTTRWLPFCISSLILLIFIKNSFKRRIIKIAALYISIAGVVYSVFLSYQEYEKAIGPESYVLEKIREDEEKEKKEEDKRKEVERRKKRKEEEKRKEEKIGVSELKNNVYLSDQGITYNTETWKEDDTVYYSHEGKYTYRNVIKGDTHHDIYGVKIKGEIKNKLKYRSVKIKVYIKAKGEVESNCALLGCVKWGGKRIDDTFTMTVPPGGKNFSKYYDLTVKAWTTGMGITGGKSAGTYLESKPDINIKILK